MGSIPIDNQSRCAAFAALPQQYITQGSGIGGVIKQRPGDFIVEELQLYDCCGEGEHLYLSIEKTGVAHAELMSILRRYFGVPDFAIGFAGMKDKMGVTRQIMSIHLPGLADPPLELPHERIKVLWSNRHKNKLRRGHLRGNRFEIRIRNVSIDQADSARRTLEQLQRIGVPAAFGPQRFGYRRNNHLLGAMMLRGDWDAFVHEVVGTGVTAFPEYQRERRELADQRQYEQALGHWAAADRAERRLLQALSKKANPKQACLSLDHGLRLFMISAFQSAIFNQVLDERIADGSMGSLMAGDLAWKHDSRSVFAVTDDELATGALPARLEAIEISPSGPLWGKGMTTAGGATAERERAAFDAAVVPYELFLESRFVPEGARRPLRSPIANIDVQTGSDEHGEYIKTMFDLPRGTYATIALREVMKNDGVVDGESQGGGESDDEP